LIITIDCLLGSRCRQCHHRTALALTCVAVAGHASTLLAADPVK
jgi:hypothetical protein